jgi:Carboxypeptidase regulatory-like domain
MRQTLKFAVLVSALFALAQCAFAQSDYQVISVTNGGTISGTVKWSGPMPHLAVMPITKDPQICDPEHHKTRDLERLIVGENGGVENTVVFLKTIAAGKAMDIPQPRRFLNQKYCRYEPHILVVPENTALQMESSDATLHTIHMDGAASYNLPFPFPNQIISRDMSTPGLVNLRCNGGHTWMNAEMFVVKHPYYAVTDESGRFTLKDVPPGQYQLIAWHEGWKVLRQEGAFDVLTERKVERPVFSEPKTWEKDVTVRPNGTTEADFTLSEK